MSETGAGSSAQFAGRMNRMLNEATLTLLDETLPLDGNDVDACKD